MVMIPVDVGIRLRTQTEVTPTPVTPVAEIPGELNELRPGQLFSARIQEVLPENTYRALVAGRSLTLALPEGAKTGDTLELVVVDRAPRAIIAKLAHPTQSSGEASTAAPYTSLSRTAQIISGLMARDGQTPPPAALTRGGHPLLAQAPENAAAAAKLAPQMAKAASQSGLFYEAHQAQWVMGQRPLADLLNEPQAQHSNPQTLAALRQNEETLSPSLPPPSPPHKESLGALAILQKFFGFDETPAQPIAQETPNAPQKNAADTIPEDIRPLVQQQLDAASTQRLAWHGDVWPNQPLEWRIEPDDSHDNDHEAHRERDWITSLRLTTPRLGEIDARLRLASHGIGIAIVTPYAGSAERLRSAIPALQQALAAAGIELLSCQISCQISSP